MELIEFLKEYKGIDENDKNATFKYNTMLDFAKAYSKANFKAKSVGYNNLKATGSQVQEIINMKKSINGLIL